MTKNNHGYCGQVWRHLTKETGKEQMIPEMVINTQNRQRRSNTHSIDALRKNIYMPTQNRRKPEI